MSLCSLFSLGLSKSNKIEVATFDRGKVRDRKWSSGKVNCWFGLASSAQGAATQSNASIIDARQPRVNHALTLGVATQRRVNF